METATDKHWTFCKHPGVVNRTRVSHKYILFAIAVTDGLELERVKELSVDIVLCMWPMGSLDADVTSINGSHTVTEVWAVGEGLEAIANFNTLCQCGEAHNFV